MTDTTPTPEAARELLAEIDSKPPSEAIIRDYWSGHAAAMESVRPFVAAYAEQADEIAKLRAWRDGYDEGEIAERMGNDTNPHPEGSPAYCGWSFGFWSNRKLRLLRAEVAASRKMLNSLVQSFKVVHPDVIGEYAAARAANTEHPNA